MKPRRRYRSFPSAMTASRNAWRFIALALILADIIQTVLAHLPAAAPAQVALP